MEKRTSNTFLYRSTTESGTYSKVIDITSYPDIFAAPDKLDISDLSSDQKHYTPGMKDVPDMKFKFNYTKAGYTAVKAFEGTVAYYQIRFGVNGEYGAWQWSGDIFATPLAGDVGGKREGEITCYPESDIAPVTITPPSP